MFSTKFLLPFVLLLASCGSLNKNEQEETTSSNQEISTPNLPDSSFNLKEDNTDHISTKQGTYAPYFWDLFEFSDIEKAEYLLAYERSKAEGDSVIKLTAHYRNIIQKWIPLLYDTGKFIVQKSCEFNRRWHLTDSTFIVYYPDGLSVYPVLEAQQNQEEYLIKSKDILWTFRLKDSEKGVYELMEGSRSVNYIVSLPNVKFFDIVKEECPDY